MSQSSDINTDSSSSSLALITPTIFSLPPDALLCVLSYLSAIDLSNLHDALPRNSQIRQIVAHPYIWRTLYAKDFPPLTSAVPYLRVTAHGLVDWRAAYWSAERRRIVIRDAGRRGWGFRSSTDCPDTQTATETGAAAGGIRVVLQGNVRRIISDRQGHPTVVDGRRARFDWSARSSQDLDHQHDDTT